MAGQISGINPKILIWARERAGLAVEDVAQSMGKDTDVISSWESGESSPTYIQLERLAYKVFKRPLAVFFLPAPLDEPDPDQFFRTLPDFEIDNLENDTLYALRQAQAMQLSLSELHEGVNPAEQSIFAEIQASPDEDVIQLAKRVRSHIGVDLREQVDLRNTNEALKFWRDIVQDYGIYIFKRSFKQRSISGFCLWDDIFPLIYINNSTSDSRQIFTIFHELGHLLLRISGVTKLDDTYIATLKGPSRQAEIFCNKFASEFLVPSVDFEKHLRPGLSDDNYFADLANRYKVSREVILRRMLDRGLVSETFYNEKSRQWNEEYEQMQMNRGSGGNYYATQATYLGKKYLDLVFSKYYQGKIGMDQLANYLNVKVKSVAGLENFASRNAT